MELLEGQVDGSKLSVEKDAGSLQSATTGAAWCFIPELQRAVQRVLGRRNEVMLRGAVSSLFGISVN